MTYSSVVSRDSVRINDRCAQQPGCSSVQYPECMLVDVLLETSLLSTNPTGTMTRAFLSEHGEDLSHDEKKL
jgi:hypothetical protein